MRPFKCTLDASASEIDHKDVPGEDEEKGSLVENNLTDLSPIDQPIVQSNTIEELKLKLEKKDPLIKPRSKSPASPVSPTQLPEEAREEMIPERRSPPLLTDDGLIAPRKPINPVREDPGRQSLHRELLFNQKMSGTQKDAPGGRMCLHAKRIWSTLRVAGRVHFESLLKHIQAEEMGETLRKPNKFTLKLCTHET
ncbi:hypothetical protein YQE_08521, partial [Dendroctonus ponderosae]